jgi:hypothetical protein
VNGAYWRPALDLFNRTFAGPLGRGWTFCFYTTDTGCDLAVHPSDTGRSIKLIGADLAWEIYDHFSRFNIAVDAVGHSMGGLIIRAALTGVQKHDPAFPPYLFVEDAITIATPNRGAPPSGWCAVGPCSVQVHEMEPGSSFLTWLDDTPTAGWATDWTVLGFDDDPVVAAQSAAPDDFPAQHKIIYAKGQWPKLYAHMSVIADSRDGRTYDRCDYYRTSCNIADHHTWPTYQNAEGPLTLTSIASYWVLTY